MPMLSGQDLALLNDQSLEELYAQLGRADDPAIDEVALSTQSLQALQIDGDAKAVAWPDWISRGFQFFEATWSKINWTVCSFYKEYSEVDKDWIERLAQAVVGLLNIGWGVALIIVQIAIKRGLNALCPT